MRVRRAVRGLGILLLVSLAVVAAPSSTAAADADGSPVGSVCISQFDTTPFEGHKCVPPQQCPEDVNATTTALAGYDCVKGLESGYDAVRPSIGTIVNGS